MTIPCFLSIFLSGDHFTYFSIICLSTYISLFHCLYLIKCVDLISSHQLDVYQDWGVIISRIENEMSFVRLKSVQLSDLVASQLVSSLELNPRSNAVLTRGVCLVAVFQAENGCEIMNKELGNMTGVIVTTNGSQTTDLLSLLLPLKTTSTLDCCTCCVIKPHAVKSKSIGGILDIVIKQGYEISAVDSFQFDKRASEEFLEVYKGVVPEYSDHVVQLSSGNSVCLEIRAENAVEVFRTTAGPWDIDMAKELRPASIRAKFAMDKVRNAVHCTELASDGQLECEYCFHIVAPSS